MEKNFKRTLVTTALPYANGPVHIGHLAGVYVPADIYTRYLRLKGEDVIMIGGSDEHGVPITIKAKAEGVTPQDIVDRYHNIIKKSFEEFGISFDIYSRTTSKIHSEMASDFFRKLYDKGEFIENKLDPSLVLLEDPQERCSGPLFVRGGIPIDDTEGVRYELRNRVTLCRCGASSNKPFCDGTHASIRFRDGLPGPHGNVK